MWNNNYLGLKIRKFHFSSDIIFIFFVWHRLLSDFRGDQLQLMLTTPLHFFCPRLSALNFPFLYKLHLLILCLKICNSLFLTEFIPFLFSCLSTNAVQYPNSYTRFSWLLYNFIKLFITFWIRAAFSPLDEPCSQVFIFRGPFYRDTV